MTGLTEPVQTSAPAKVILLGEHSVVYGKPALAVAVDLRMRCTVHDADRFSLNGMPLSPSVHSYVSECISRKWHGSPLAITTDADFPSGSGLGSSAAVTVSLLAALIGGDTIDQETIAKEAFEVEMAVQGRASPVDTSTCTHGRALTIRTERGENFLWHIKKGEREWYVHHCDAPNLSLVIGFTGRSAPTGPLVAKVKRFVDRSTFAREIIDELGDLTEEGRRHLIDNDRVGLGKCMTKAHKLLAILGVSSPELDKLVTAVLPHSYGAKLTGGGGGGSMVSLTENPVMVAEIIRRKGGTPYMVSLGADGVKFDKGFR